MDICLIPGVRAGSDFLLAVKCDRMMLSSDKPNVEVYQYTCMNVANNGFVMKACIRVRIILMSKVGHGSSVYGKNYGILSRTACFTHIFLLG